MATYSLSNVGVNTDGTTVAVALNATAVKYALINDSDAPVNITLAPGSSNVTVAEGLSHKIPAKSFKMLTVSEANVGADTLAVSAISTTHKTSAQLNEVVYLTAAIA